MLPLSSLPPFPPASAFYNPGYCTIGILLIAFSFHITFTAVPVFFPCHILFFIK